MKGRFWYRHTHTNWKFDLDRIKILFSHSRKCDVLKCGLRMTVHTRETYVRRQRGAYSNKISGKPKTRKAICLLGIFLERHIVDPVFHFRLLVCLACCLIRGIDDNVSWLLIAVQSWQSNRAARWRGRKTKEECSSFTYNIAKFTHFLRIESITETVKERISKRSKKGNKKSRS